MDRAPFHLLGMPARTIAGSVAAVQRQPACLIVAVIQSMVRSGLVDDLVSNYGHLIVDECHHLSAQSFEQVARQAKAKFVTGLSATVTRKDGQHPIIFMECGPVRYWGSVRQGVATHPFEHKVVVRPTGFRPLRPADPDVRVQFHKLYEELMPIRSAINSSVRTSSMPFERAVAAGVDRNGMSILTL